jgi:serine/threonine-protein kinase
MLSADPLLHSSCPAPDTLEAFHLGKLPEPGLETLAAHIATCPLCSSLLEQMQQRLQSDGSLLERLRRCADEHTPPQESACDRLEAAARAIPLAEGLLGQSTLAESAAPPPTPASEARTLGRARQEPPLPAEIGPYEILGRLGRGGMGVVYKARQRSIKRLVALKMVLAGAHAGSQARARLRTEGQAIARLRHPHVVQIFDFDEHDGMPYYAMEFMEGGSLSAKLSTNPLPPRQAAELVRTLAEAVEYAHQAKVLHRDLKPANILLSTTGEPKIADFGLAKLLDSDDGNTLTEMVIGTPSYMAPEQAAGRHNDVGPATDVYSLGAILYETLTGRPPFKESTRTETRRHVVHEPPKPPSQLRRDLPRVLEAICLKCLEKTPARRYASAQALADDLARWLRGEPTVARPLGMPARLGRWARRHVVSLAGLSVLALLLAGLYLRSSQRYLQQVQAQLARGTPVPLVESTGAPRWYRWRAGESRSSVGAVRDGTFALNTWSNVSLLELLPQLPVENYRFTAQVRHQNCDQRDGYCGVYFGHEGVPATEGELQHCLCLYFNDIHASAALFAEVAAQLRARAPKSGVPLNNQVHLAAQLFCNTVDQPTRICRIGLASGAPFTPYGLKDDAPWHTVDVLITPDLVRARWDQRVVVELTAAEYAIKLDAFLAQRREKFPHETPVLAAAPSRFRARGGLGLLLKSGAATFREVAIVPVEAER